MPSISRQKNMNKRILAALVIILISGSVSLPSARGISRYNQEIDSQVSFAWNTVIQLPKGQLSAVLNVPLSIKASGLPNKVMPTESFQIPVSIVLATGVQLWIGGQEFNLDSIIPFALSYVPTELDLTQYIKAITCAIAVAAIAADPPTCAFLVSIVLDQIKLSLVNQLIITGQATGPAQLTSSVLQTWFTKDATFSLDVTSFTQRGEQVALALVSAWSVSLYLDFKQSVYDNPVVGWFFKEIRDAIHLPWQPSIGIAQASSTPSMTSIVLIPDFQLASSERAITLTQGQSSNLQVTVNPIDEFDNSVTLSVAQAPQDVQVLIQNNQILPSSSTTLSINVFDSAPAGDYQISVTAIGGGKTHELSIPIHISERVVVNPSTAATQPGSQTSQPFAPSIDFQFGLAIVVVLIVGIATAGVIVSRSGVRTSFKSTVGAHQGQWFCRYCGNRIEHVSTYCGHCGRKLE